TDGDGEDGIADVGEFASRLSAGHARRDQVDVEVTAVRALDGPSRIVFREEDGLHFPGLQRLQHAAEAGDTTSVGLGEIQRLADFGRGAFRDPLIENGGGAIANLFVRNAGYIG